MYTYNNMLYKHNKTHFSDFLLFGFLVHFNNCSLSTARNLKGPLFSKYNQFPLTQNDLQLSEKTAAPRNTVEAILRMLVPVALNANESVITLPLFLDYHGNR